MAISKSFFGLRKGSTKSHTYQTYRGMQVTKDRVYDVANPQTDAQMKQRLKLPMVANARAVLKTLVDHSFEGEIYGEPSLKRFSQLNLSKGALTITSYVPKGAMDCGLADFIISKGSLPQQTVQMSNDRPTLAFVPNGTVESTELNFDEDDKPTADPAVITVKQLKAIASFFGFQEGQQLTTLLMRAGDNYTYVAADNSEKTAHYHRFVISRLMFNFEDGDKRWKISQDTDGRVTLDDGFVTIGIVNRKFPTLETTESGDIEAAAVILSQQIDGNWKRSTSRLFINTNNADTDYHVTFADANYSYIKAAADSNRYLNSGLEGVDIPGGNV